jgi:putative peptidoglycan lipid II flippase
MADLTPSRRTTLNLVTLTLAGKVLAIGKTLFIAALFGTSSHLDAFWVAYSLPLLLPNVLSLTITTAFVPRFVASLEGRSSPEVWKGANTLFTSILILIAIGGAAMFVWASPLIGLLAPGLSASTHDEAVGLIRLMVPSTIMLAMNSLLSALSYARASFVAPGLEGIVNNIAVICIAGIFARYFGVGALMAGVTVGFAAHLAVLAWSNRDLIRSSFRFSFAFGHPDFRGPFAHMLPLLVGYTGTILTLLVNQYFVSNLSAGSISALSYASMLSMLPLEVFTNAVTSTYYPALGRAFAAGDRKAAAETYFHGMRFLLLLTLPSAVLLVVYSKPVVVLLLQHGSFDAHSTELTVQTMTILSIAMMFRSHTYFSYRVLNSALQAWTQVTIGLLGVVTAILLNTLWAEKLGLRGIALSTTISSLQSAILSSICVRRLLGTRTGPDQWRELARVVVPIAVLGVAAYLGQALVPDDLKSRSNALWALAAGMTVIPAALLAFGVAWKLRIPEVSSALALAGRLARRVPLGIGGSRDG